MVRVQSEESVRLMEEQNQLPRDMQFEHAAAQSMMADDADEAGQGGESRQPQPAPRPDQVKVGRNDACPCGSGQKYKYCHGKLA